MTQSLDPQNYEWHKSELNDLAYKESYENFLYSRNLYKMQAAYKEADIG